MTQSGYPAYIPGNMSTQAAQKLRDNLAKLFERFYSSGRRRTVGTLVGAIRTKEFPPNAIAGQQTKIVFVADVRLRELEYQPLVRDVLVTNQAHALVANTDADGTPVAVEISKSGTLTIVGRAAIQNSAYNATYYTLDNLNGNEMEFLFGLRLKTFGDLDAGLRSRIAAWRADNGLPVLGVNDQYFEDPQISVHGPEYYIGYIGTLDGGRFTSDVVVVCSTQTVSRDWYDDTQISDPDGDWWYGTPDKWASQDPWYAANSETVCEEV